MPRNSCWNKDENEFITGVLGQYGDKPRNWPEEVKAMIKEKLANRTESGIYQQALKLIKSRASVEEAPTAEQQGFFNAKGA
jgi:hypothetical protein